MSTFAAERTVKARTQHRCGECGRTINPGETYQRAAGVWWGDFWHMATCAHCAAFRPIIQQYDPEYYESYYGGIGSWVSDGASDDVIGDSRLPWTDRMRLFRLCRLACNQWRVPSGALAPVPKACEGGA